MCYLKEINEIGACRLCIVEVEGQERLVPSCNNAVAEGMVIHTNSPRVREARRMNLRLLLSQHEIRLHQVYPQRQLPVFSSWPTIMNLLGDQLHQGPAEHPARTSPFPVVRDARTSCIKLYALRPGLRQGPEHARLGRDGYRLPHHRRRVPEVPDPEGVRLHLSAASA